jgi:predicted esterase
MHGMAKGLLLAGWAAAASPAAGQQAPAGSPREALAAGYMKLELALRDAAADARHTGPAERQRINRDFDAVTLRFFSGDLQGALAGLNALVAQVAGPEADAGALDERAAAVLRGLAEEQRVADGTAGSIHYMVHVPAGPAPARGWPLLVALHGAGGDERMFFGAYGAGVIRALADTHGIAVATPRAPMSTAALLELVDHLAASAPVDRGRVGLLGHSMGAAVVFRAAQAHPDRFRGVVCLAGSCGGGEADGPPVLMIAGALDPLFRVDLLSGQADALRGAGRSVEFRTLPDEGHTLMVGVALPAAMAWLAGRLR